MKKSLPFRTWFYFRQGWTTYFAFIFAAINTLTVTYYLAIENYPQLQNIFPTFLSYIVIIVLVGIPLLVLVGYVHYKRSSAFKAEADINIEANPHLRRILINTELLLSAYLHLIQLITKLANNEKLTENQLEEISKLQKELSEHINNRTIGKD